MHYDPARHHRRSIRLPGFDYTSRGAYFLTICAQDRRMLFSRLPVVDMLVTWWQRLGDKFPDVQLDEAVVMPNHFHGVVWLADGCAEARTSLFDVVHWYKTMTTNAYIRGVRDHTWSPFPGRLWQRNYWEHIVRDDADLNRIRDYIRDNPIRWERDKLHPLQPPYVGEETPF